MDGTVLYLFMLATLIGGVVTGLAGFAFGLVVSGIWLHVITPLQSAILICSYGIMVQAYGIWLMRHHFRWRHVVPLLIGAAFGVPVGVWLLHFIEPRYLRLAVGVLLIAYAFYSLLRPHVKGFPANVPVELGVGFLSGTLGGMTGLSGVFVTLWCGMRAWSKDMQRSVYQPVIFASFVLSDASYVAAGAINRDVIKLFLFGLPPLLAGVLIGFKLYDRLDDATFRKVILVLLLISGCALAIPELMALA